MKRRISLIAAWTAVSILLAAPSLPLPVGHKPTTAQLHPAAANEPQTDPNSRLHRGRAELFDVRAGRVLRSFAISGELRREAEAMLLAVTGPVGQARIDPQNGYLLRLELAPPLHASLPVYRGDVPEMIVLLDPAASSGFAVRLLLTHSGSIAWLETKRKPDQLLRLIGPLY